MLDAINVIIVGRCGQPQARKRINIKIIAIVTNDLKDLI